MESDLASTSTLDISQRVEDAFRSPRNCMSSLEQTNHRSPPREVVSHEEIVDWLAQARACILSSTDAALLDFDGVDAFEASLAELYLTTLATLRRGPHPQPARTSVYRRLREFAYRAKRRRVEMSARRHSGSPTTADFLFWPRDITHTTAHVAIAKQLTAQGASLQFLTCQPSILDQCRERGIRPVYPLQAWPGAVRLARREGHRRARALTGGAPWRLPDFGEVSGTTLEPGLRATLGRMLPVTAESVTNAREALRRIQPRVLVVGNDLTVEGSVGCRVAEQVGVTTAVFMHGTITGIPMQASHLADRIFVYGDIHRQEILRHGFHSDRIVVCGDPNMDGRLLQSKTTHLALASQLGLKDGEPWILVATSGPGHRISHKHHETMVANLLELARGIPGVPLVIKLHRKDSLAYYQSILKAAGDLPLHVIPAGAEGFPSDIFAWLPGCRMVLTGASTTAIEAMAMDIPIVTMDYCGELYSIDFIDAGATVHVTTAKELVAGVKQILATGGLPAEVQERAATFLKGTYFALDGQSSRRAAEALRALAAQDR